MPNAYSKTLALALAGLAASCTSKGFVRAETAAAQILVSDEQEKQIGQQVQEELKKEKIKYLEDPQVNDYVLGLARKIYPHAAKDRPNVPWNTHVVDDPKTVNAFATPGGHLYIITGLLLAADNEAEVAGVLSHEVGHVVGRHSARQMVQAFGLQTIAAVALGKDPGTLAKIATTIGTQGALLAHSRSDENEADEYGARYASAAGYDPKGLATFFQKLGAQEGKVPQVFTWLSTHPATPDRIAHVNAFIAQNNLRGSDLGADRLALVKQRIKQLSGVR